MWGVIDRWDHRVRPKFAGVVAVGKFSDPGVGPYRPRLQLDLNVGPGRNSSHSLAPQDSANHKPASAIGASRP